MPDEPPTDDPPASPPDRSAAAASGGDGGLGWFYAALALLGGCIGLAIGLSSTPVVAVVVPLLFSLIAGSSGFYAAGQDLSQPEARARIARLGRMLVAFTVPVILASLYGAVVRTGAEAGSLLPRFGRAVEEGPAPLLTAERVGSQGIDAALEVAALRYRLRLLGADDAEIAAVTEAAIARTLAPPALAAVVAAFQEIAARAAQARDAFTDEMAARLPPDQLAGLDQLLRQVEMIRDEYAFYGQRLQAMPGSPNRVLLSRLQQDAERLSAALHDRYGPAAAGLAGLPELQAGLWELELAFFDRIATLGGVDWMSGGRIAEQTDRLLGTTGAGAAAAAPAPADRELSPSFAP